MKKVGAALLLGGAFAVVACAKSSGSETTGPTPSAKPQASAAPATASAPPPATATASARPEPPVYAARKVPAGMAGEVWLPSFEIVRDKGNTGLSYLEAMNKCAASGKALCTDSQWTRACEADAELAKIETWTASGVGGNRFVIRGGTEAACRARDVVDGAEKNAGRAAVCCERAIGIKTGNKNEAFLKTSEKRLEDYESALRAKDTLSLGSQYDDKITFLGKEYPRAELIKLHERYYKQFPDQWTMFDTCTVSIEKLTTDKGPDSKLASDCRTLFHRKGAVTVAMQRFLWGGTPSKVQLIGDPVTSKVQAPDGAMIEEKETKERVGMLLAAD